MKKSAPAKNMKRIVDLFHEDTKSGAPYLAVIIHANREQVNPY